MSAIRGKDTLPEMLVRKMLFANGYRFRCQYKKLPGRPDVVLPKLRTVIDIRGCFWHRHGWGWDGRRLVKNEECAVATMPKTNKAFWSAKFKANVQRDMRNEQAWHEAGWNYIVVWECALVPREREKTFAFILRTLKEWSTFSSL